MQCEICGATIHGRSTKILVDRAELEVCDKCKGFGKEVERRAPITSVQRGAAYGAVESSPRPAVRRGRRDIFDQMKEELVEDYADVIKNAREARHMTQEELAAKILEKVNIIRKVERGELMPENTLIKKLEATLNVKLTEGVEDPENLQRRSDSKTMTLGDLIKVRKNKGP